MGIPHKTDLERYSECCKENLALQEENKALKAEVERLKEILFRCQLRSDSPCKAEFDESLFDHGMKE